MSKQRAIVTVVSLVLLLVGGLIGIWMYIDTDEKLLSRNKWRDYNKKAIRLGTKFIEEHPDDWEGYHVAGAAYSRQKNYAKAIELLTQGVEKDPRQVHVVLELARAHAEPGLISLDVQVKSKVRVIAVLREAIDHLTAANQALMLGKPDTEVGKIDLLETRGRNLDRIGVAQWMVAQAVRESQPDQAQQAQEAGDAAQDEAIEVLLEVLRRGGKRDKSAEVLYRLCKERNATKAMEEVRKIILSMQDPPPAAHIAIMIEAPSASHKTDNPAQWARNLRKNARMLDALIKANPEKNVLAKRLRASVAMALRDHPTAERLCKEILKANPDHAFARLILARVRMSSGNVTDAERDLFRLAARYKRWPEVHRAYAEAARRVGKGTATSKPGR